MTNADWWQQAHGPSADSPKAPEPDTQIKRLGVLWTLTWNTHSAQAELWGIEAIDAYDLRYFIDGGLHSTELFRGAGGGTKETVAALDKRDELIARGWVNG